MDCRSLRLIAVLALCCTCSISHAESRDPPLKFGITAVILQDLLEKREVEQHMVGTERLAAFERLSTGVAHEINNPLGGMLTALSTYRRHGAREALSQRTVSLLERGLPQIRETVPALLVEAKLETHPLSAHDISRKNLWERMRRLEIDAHS